MEMIISGVSTTKEGKQVAYVRFEDNSRAAEAVIPECKFIKNKGFTDDEISQMVDYLKKNLTELKKEAAKINPLKAIMD